MLKYFIPIFLGFLCFYEVPYAQEVKRNYSISTAKDDLPLDLTKKQKVESNLATLYRDSQRPSSYNKGRLSVQWVTIDAVATKDAQQLAEDLRQLGMVDGAVFGRVVSGRVPVHVIQELNQLESLLFARQALGEGSMGASISQGDKSIQADIARAELCVDGSGVKVGVLSDSYNNLNGAGRGIASGDLPGKNNPNGYHISVDAVNDDFFGADEGRAMLEIVHDVAPGAALAFHTSLGGQSSFANGIRALAQAGCDVIVDDWKYFAEPFFQDGIIAQAIEEVTAQGVAYFAFSGNHARLSYENEFRPKSITINGEKVTAHNFGKGDVFQRILVPPGRTMTISLQWKDRYASVKPGAKGAATDLDIYLLDELASNTVVQSTSNNIGFDPVELITHTNSTNSFETLNILITKFSGPSPELIKYVIFNQTSSAIIDEYSTMSPTIVGHSNAASAITIGAANYRNTPAFGKSLPIIESFSSAGGVPVFFDVEGKALKQSIRSKPDITAPDGGNSTFFGTDTDGDGFPNFFGTSASAPHAAATAALMLEAAEKQIAPSQIKEVLKTTAVKMNDPSTSGAGLIQADKAVAKVTTQNHCNTYTATLAQFELINTITNTPLQVLNEGDVIDLDAIENVPLSIRAIPDPEEVGSIELVLEGPLSIQNKENVMPYTLFGDHPAFKYAGERFPTGSYTIKAIPFAKPDLQGDSGTPLTIHFEVKAKYAMQSFSLINAESSKEIKTLKDGDVIDLESVGNNLNVRAHPSAETVGSVRFVLTGPVSETHVENEVPYALFGDIPLFTYLGKRLPSGNYTLTATPYSNARAKGITGTPLTISFDVADKIAGILSQETAFQEHQGLVQGKFSVFPVPTSNTLNIVHENDKNERVELLLYDELTGKVISSHTLHGKNKAVLSLQQHPTGNYILKIISQEAVHTFKIFKQ